MGKTCEKLFSSSLTLEDYTNSLVAYLPGGDLFAAKNVQNSVLRQLFTGLAMILQDVSNDINDVTYQYDINCTTDLIAQWESALGIPDQCFSGAENPLDQRRRDVLAKLSSLGVSTAKGFVDLAALFGFTALVETSGSAYGIFPLSFPIAFFQYPQDARFTLYIIIDSTNAPEVFPFSITKFPIPFFGSESNIVECLISRLAPANVQVVFQYAPLNIPNPPSPPPSTINFRITDTSDNRITASGDLRITS